VPQSNRSAKNIRTFFSFAQFPIFVFHCYPIGDGLVFGGKSRRLDASDGRHQSENRILHFTSPAWLWFEWILKKLQYYTLPRFFEQEQCLSF
jgi:hypothetical protein